MSLTVQETITIHHKQDVHPISACLQRAITLALEHQDLCRTNASKAQDVLNDQIALYVAGSVTSDDVMDDAAVEAQWVIREAGATELLKKLREAAASAAKFLEVL